MDQQRGNSPLIAVLVVAVIAIVAVVAYQQGYLGGDSKEGDDVDINLPGGNGGY